MAAAIKMDELLVYWLGGDHVFEDVMEWIDNFRAAELARQQQAQEQAAAMSNASSTVSEEIKIDHNSNNKDNNSGSTPASTTAGGAAKPGNDSNADANTVHDKMATLAVSDGTTSAESEMSSSLKDGDSKNSNNTQSSESGIGNRSPRGVIPPFYNVPPSSDATMSAGGRGLRRRTPILQHDTWDPLPSEQQGGGSNNNDDNDSEKPFQTPTKLQKDNEEREDKAKEANTNPEMEIDHGDDNNISSPTSPLGVGNLPQIKKLCVRDQAEAIYFESGQDPPSTSPKSIHSDSTGNNNSEDTAGKDEKDGNSEGGAGEQAGDEKNNETSHPPASSASASSHLKSKYLMPENFCRITKEVCRFPSFFNLPLFQRILDLWNERCSSAEGAADDVLPMEVVTFEMFEYFWRTEMEPHDPCDRFFRLVKQPGSDYIVRDDFLPYIKALLNDHPGLEFLSSHAEFQEKYAVTVITRIFYTVNTCHTGRITSRQVRRSDLLDAFQQVDEEEDINKVTRYFSYEHFYVLYCRFWELDHDRDYRITREDLLKYGDHSMSHMIVDRLFDAAPRPFDNEDSKLNRDYLSYEDFIYFMLSEEDKANEVSVRYWFHCVDVDGDGKLNNMEMRSFYAVQLHRMQCMGHEIVPFEDMLCQMMDMIKPAQSDYLVATDFLQPECCQVSGALFDALFNLNKYLMFEQRDPFAERQKREDEFLSDWDRFACIDYNRLAMEEEAREEEAMEIDWVTVDDDDDHHHQQQQDQQQQFSDHSGDGDGDILGGAIGSGNGAAGAGTVTASEAPF